MTVGRSFRLHSSLALLISGHALACGSEEADDGVLVLLSDTYRLASGEEIVQSTDRYDLIEARVTDAAGATRIYPAVLSADGARYEIAGVPEGPYWLVTQQNRLAQLNFEAPQPLRFTRHTARTIDHGAVYAGRPDLAYATKPTMVALHASALEVPWQQLTVDDDGNLTQPLQDSFELHAHDADSLTLLVPGDPADEPNAPVDGATAVNGWAFDWVFSGISASRIGAGISLVDGGRGDKTVAAHMVQHHADDTEVTPDGYDYEALEESFIAEPFTMRDGEPAEVRGKFEKLALETQALDWQASKFVAEVRANGPAPLVVLNQSLSISQDPGAPEPIIGSPASLLSVVLPGRRVPVDPACAEDDLGVCPCETGCPTEVVPAGDLLGSFQFGNPYSAGQPLFGGSLTMGTNVRHPVTDLPIRLRGGLEITLSPADAGAGPISPRLGLPRNIKVGGESWPADTIESGLGTAPAVSWEPPAFGNVSRYSVAVFQWSDKDDAENDLLATRTTILAFNTDETSVALPDGMLVSGGIYSVLVSALDDGFRPEQPNRYHSTTVLRSRSYTGPFMP